jgi:hypothetical protein
MSVDPPPLIDPRPTAFEIRSLILPAFADGSRDPPACTDSDGPAPLGQRLGGIIARMDGWEHESAKAFLAGANRWPP